MGQINGTSFRFSTYRKPAEANCFSTYKQLSSKQALKKALDMTVYDSTTKAIVYQLCDKYMIYCMSLEPSEREISIALLGDNINRLI